MDEQTKQLITLLNDMYYSQSDEYKSRYRENYFELLRHLMSPSRDYCISGGEIAEMMNRKLRNMNKE